MAVCNNKTKQTLLVKKQFNSMRKLDDLHQIFLSEIKPYIYMQTHKSVAIPHHASKAQYEKESKKKNSETYY